MGEVLLDLTKSKAETYSTSYSYSGMETNIAMYAVTKISDQLHNCRIVNSVKWTDSPTTVTFEVDYKQNATVYRDVLIYADEGLVSAVMFYNPNYYRVELTASSAENLEKIKDIFLSCLEDSNFYRGKCVKFTRNELGFMPRPHKTFDKVVLAGNIYDEYKTTVIDFLLNPKMQDVCKKRRVLLYGPPGCLAADTRIVADKSGHTRHYTVKELYDKFNGLSTRKTWDIASPLKVKSLCGNTIRYNTIEGVWHKGKLPTFTVKSKLGYSICVTAEHPFKVPHAGDEDGFKPLRDLKVGDSILVEGSKKINHKRKSNPARKDIYGMDNHPCSWTKRVGKYTYKHVYYARLVIEAELNKMGVVEEFIQLIRDTPKSKNKLKFLPQALEVHHINFDPTDDRKENLEALTKAEHLKKHKEQWIKNLPNSVPVLDTIVSIDPAGIKDTYDITMKEYHNYIAEGFIVHNTGKTSLVSATFNQLSQNNITCISLNDINSMRMSIEEIFDFICKFLAPAYIVFEDIDLIGYDRNNGLNSVVGRLLSIFDGVEESEKAIVLCSTTNREEVLDKAFTRPCRVDRKFHLDFLKEKELEKLFTLLLDVPVPGILKGKQLTGSHIQEIADTAKLLASKNGGDPKLYVEEATRVVVEHFYLSKGNDKVGFSGGTGGFAPETVEECNPAQPYDPARSPWEEHIPMKGFGRPICG